MPNNNEIQKHFEKSFLRYFSFVAMATRVLHGTDFFKEFRRPCQDATYEVSSKSHCWFLRRR
jgi:hypothetical protein